MSEPTRLEFARNFRRAADLFHAVRTGQVDDIEALIGEARGEDLIDVVSSLLRIGLDLIETAEEGRSVDEHLEQLRGASLVAEAMTEGGADA